MIDPDPDTLEVLREVDNEQHNTGAHRVTFPELLELRGGLTYEQTLIDLQRAGTADVWVEPSEPGAPLSRTITVGGAGAAPAAAFTFSSPEPRWLGLAEAAG